MDPESLLMLLLVSLARDREKQMGRKRKSIHFI